jgi:PAS domain S-box-containing protein
LGEIHRNDIPKHHCTEKYPNEAVEAHLGKAKKETECEIQKRTAGYIRTNKELQDINQFNSLLLNHSPMPILVTNPDSSVRYVNKAVEKLTGFSAAELLDTKVPYPFWHPDRRAKYLAEFQGDSFRKIRGLEKTIQNKKGEKFWVELTLIPVRVNRKLEYIISTWVNLTEEKKLRRELELYSQRIMEVREEERKRVADELHDDVAQSLAVLSLELDSLSRLEELQSEKILQRLRLLKEDANRAMQTVRKYSYELRPGMLEHLGLLAALEQIVFEMNERGQLEIKFEVSGQERKLVDEMEIALFRIAQAALSNVIQHSQATQSTVSIKYRLGKIQLQIQDNGQGFSPNQERVSTLRGGSLGLVSMREWAKIIQADLKIRSQPGKGTIVTVEVKL